MSLTFLLALAALSGATLSAIAGLGGGTLLIGAMFALGLSPALAIPLHALVQWVSNGTRALAYREHVAWRSVAVFALASLPWPFFTALWVAQASPDVIRLLLAALIIYTLSPTKPRFSRPWPVGAKMSCAGVLAGLFGPVIGATGPMIAPFFLDPRWSKETTVGSMAAAQCIAHAVKILAFGSVGVSVLEHWELALPLMLAVALGTWLGRHAMKKISKKQFVALFRLVLMLLAARLLWLACAGLTKF